MEDVFVMSAVRTPIGKYGGGLAAVPPSELAAHGGARGGQPRRRRAGRRRPRRLRQHHPHRGRDITWPGGGRQGRPAGRDAGADPEPAVRQRPAGDHHGGAGDHARRRRGGGGRRRREHEPRPVLAARHALGPAHERRRAVDIMVGRPQRPVRRLPHGRDRRERRQEVQGVPREDQDELAVGEPPPRRGRDRRQATSKSRSCRSRSRSRGARCVSRPTRHPGRTTARRRMAKLQPGVRQGRHRDRRQRLEHQRRGGGRGAWSADVPRSAACSRWAGWWATPMPASSRVSWASARCRRCARCSTGPASRSTTSTCSRSTRRSPPRRWRWSANWNCRRTRTNPNGSGISLGHPIGATGGILTVKALYELKRTGGRSRWSRCASAAVRASPRSSSGSDPNFTARRTSPQPVVIAVRVRTAKCRRVRQALLDVPGWRGSPWVSILSQVLCGQVARASP